jgi:hypothetical protein
MKDTYIRFRSPSERIAAAGGAGRAMLARRCFTVRFFTGWFKCCDDGNCRECPPKTYNTIDEALADIHRRPSWGWSAADVFSATVIPHGDDDRPDYVVGTIVANGQVGEFEVAS